MTSQKRREEEKLLMSRLKVSNFFRNPPLSPPPHPTSSPSTEILPELIQNYFQSQFKKLNLLEYFSLVALVTQLTFSEGGGDWAVKGWIISGKMHNK